MQSFKSWLKESKDWYAFHSARGNPLGKIGKAENLPMKPISKDDIPEKMDIQDVKMLHDRILDSVNISIEDLSKFIQVVLHNIPGYEDEQYNPTYDEWYDADLARIYRHWNYVAGNKNDEINMYLTNAIADAFRLTVAFSKKETAQARYFKEVLPLLRDVIKQMKSGTPKYASHVDKDRHYNRISSSAGRTRQQPFIG